ncbi:MAG: transglutaminase family protein [Rhodospirillales bacterium]
MDFKIGYEMQYSFPQPTPAIVMLNVHFSRVSDLQTPDHIILNPSLPVSGYRDGFGNWCTRFVAPAGFLTISSDTIIHDSGRPDQRAGEAAQMDVESLPEEALVFLLPSRFCDSDRMLDLAWTLFGDTEPGIRRVQAICDFVHNHISFGYQHARVTRTASEGYEEGIGVCRDFAHLGVAFCRALNIPARYCTGYLSDEGSPLPHRIGDFAAWFEAYLGGQWHMFDPRNNRPMTGRFLMAHGRDAADVAMVTTFGENTLQNFRVFAERVPGS